jgi:outer membrane protein assembly factor BamB
MNAKSLRLLPLLFLFLLPTAQLVVASALTSPARKTASLYDWLQFDFDAQHSGNNTLEIALTSANVNQLQQLFQVSLPSVADGAPVYLNSVNTSNGYQNLLFLATQAGHILALNADTGALVWSQQYGAGSCKINNGSSPCYTTSSPAIDPNRQYVYGYGLDGKVHKYKVGDGTEIMAGGWPETTTLKAFDEKGSSALSFATAQNSTSYLYMTNGGYPGDNGNYQGHVTAINLSDGTQHVFNAMCSDQVVHFVEKPGLPDCAGVQSAIWARPGVAYDPATDKIYMATGNGTFNPGNFYWGDTVFELKPKGTGANGSPLDTYTPTNYQQLQNSDADVGSTAPAILHVPAGSNVAHLAVQSGKDAKLRLLNLDNLSGQGGPGHTGGEVGGTIYDVPQGGEVLTQPAVWVNQGDGSTWVFVANGNGISALKVVLDANHTPQLQTMWQKSDGGTSPILTDNILFYASSGIIRALDPATGNRLWSDTALGGIHWESPIVANGTLYITDESGSLTAYALPSAPPTATLTATPTVTPLPNHIFLPFILKQSAP